MKTIAPTLKAKMFSGKTKMFFGFAVTALAIGVLAAPAAASGVQAQITKTSNTTLAASRVSRLCVREHTHIVHYNTRWTHLHYYPCLKPIKAPATRR